MFGKILNFRFPSVSEAKLAASFCSEKFGSKISDYNIIGLNIFISQLGDLNVSIKFENSNALNKFETNYEEIISELKKSLADYLNNGGRKIKLWTDEENFCEVFFDNDKHFENLNTLDDLKNEKKWFTYVSQDPDCGL